jgi:hypothetical protein
MSSSINQFVATEESVLMKMHLKWASVVKRSENKVSPTTEIILSEFTIKLL